MIVELYGDILETDCKLIAHGVNCQGVMGSGVARVLLEAFPGLRDTYIEFCDEKFNEGFAPSDLLGSVFLYDGTSHYIANLFTQQTYGRDQIHLNYDALHHAVSNLVMKMHELDQYELAIPKIGCGLAGGDWERVKGIFEVYFNDTSDLTLKVYSL